MSQPAGSLVPAHLASAAPVGGLLTTAREGRRRTTGPVLGVEEAIEPTRSPPRRACGPGRRERWPARRHRRYGGQPSRRPWARAARKLVEGALAGSEPGQVGGS